MNIKSLLELESRLDYFSQFSFDIFDTLVFRTVEDHTEREHEISKLISKYLNRIGISCKFQDYMTLREIEFQKSKLITKDEIDYFSSIKNILKSLNVSFDDLEMIANDVWKIEEEYEVSVAYANPEAEKILSILKRNNKNIVAVSDMYLPKSSIKAILNKVGLLAYFDNVYVSSDNKFTKHSGLIYKDLLEKGFLVKGNVIHTGDNWQSDEVMAANNSIFGLHYVNKKNEDRKSKLTLKLIKKHKFNINKCADDLSDLLGKGFALYIKQIFDCVKKYNSKKIYFFTRDANFLFSSAEEYKKKFSISGVELRILHLDRLNSFFLNIKNILEFQKKIWLFGEPSKITFYDFLNKIGYLDIYLKKNKELIDENKNISLKMALATNQLNSVIASCIERKHRDVIRYLTKEGVFSSENSILVDIGYSGTSMREISYFIRDNDLKNKQGRLDCLLFASNRFFNSNAVLFTEPVYLHLVEIFPFHRVNPFAALNHSWLEPFILDTRMGALERYDEDTLEPVRKIYDTFPIYKKINLNKKIESWFDNNLEDLNLLEIQKKLESVVVMPKRSQIEKYKELTHIKGFDNSIEQSIFKNISLFNFKEDILSLVRDDYWIGGSLRKANLSFLITIACNNIYYVRKFFRV